MKEERNTNTAKIELQEKGISFILINDDFIFLPWEELATIAEQIYKKMQEEKTEEMQGIRIEQQKKIIVQ